MLFFSIFSTSNDKNTATSNMLNLKIFSIELQWSLIFDTLLQQDARVFKYIYIYIYIFFFSFSFSLSHSLLCLAFLLHYFSLSFSFSFSMPLRFSLTLDLHFNNGERCDDEDGTTIPIFLKASSKVSWTCSLSVASTASAMLDMRRFGCELGFVGLIGVFQLWVCVDSMVQGCFVGVGLIRWCRLIYGCLVDSIVWVLS